MRRNKERSVTGGGLGGETGEGMAGMLGSLQMMEEKLEP